MRTFQTKEETRSLTNFKTSHEWVGVMRNLERLNLRSRDLNVVLFGDDILCSLIIWSQYMYMFMFSTY